MLKFLGDTAYPYRFAPSKVSGLTSVTQLAAGHYDVLALHVGGTVSSFGRNSQRTPMNVQGLTGGGVMQLAASGSHTLALHDDGTVSAFGANNNGQ